MLLRCSSRRSWILAALVTAAACRSQPAAVNPNDPEIVATVEAILDKTVAAAGALDAEGVLSASTRDDTFTFITDDRMLKGYDETLPRFARRTRCCKAKPTRSSRSAPACYRRTSCWCQRCRKAPIRTRPVSRSRPWGSAPRPCSSGAARSGESFTTINPLPNSAALPREVCMVCRVAVLAGLLAAVPAFAQVAAPKTAPPPKLTFAQIGLFIYPAKEQTPDQQKKDEDACYDWAEANTGLTLVAGSVDAEAAGKAAAKDAGKGKRGGRRSRWCRYRPGHRAIAGDAGKGAAIGAVAGSVGGVRSRSQIQAGRWSERCPTGRPGEPTGRGPVQESGRGVPRGARILSPMTSTSRPIVDVVRSLSGEEGRSEWHVGSATLVAGISWQLPSARAPSLRRSPRRRRPAPVASGP